MTTPSKPPERAAQARGSAARAVSPAAATEPASHDASTPPPARPAAPGARKGAAAVEVRPVDGPRDLDLFIRFPLEVYAGDPDFVPPLLMERRDFLDPRKNPFFHHAAHELFLARKNGRVVGRIAAVEDRNYNAFHGTHLGYFGMYEAVDEPEVAMALFQAARSWVRSRGLTSILGPLNLSTNHEAGLLVDGFGDPPAVMMTYNPRYYIRHFEEVLGLSKAKDLYAWTIPMDAEPNPKVVRIAEKVRQKEGIVVRSVKLSDFAAEALRIKEVYNEAWEKNWGFVPFTDDEFDHVAKDMKMIAKEDLLLLAEVRGEPVGFSMTLPDVNQALRHVGGRLTHFGLPIGLAKLLWYTRKIKRLRLITLGVKEKYRKRGIDAVLYIDTLRTARRLGYTDAEISWTLEDNVLVHRSIALMNGRRYKTYRLYETEA